MSYPATLRSHVTAFLFAAALCAGCGKTDGASKQVRFRYWGDTKEVAILQELIKDFEAAHPGVKVKAERKPSDRSYGDLLITEFAAGQAPDVIFLSTTNIDKLMETGQLADLGPFIAAKEGGVDLKPFYPRILKRFQHEGRTYGLPRDVAPVACVYYNKKLFDEAKLAYPKDSWNFEDLRQKALKLTRRNASGSVEVYGFSDDRRTCEAWVLSAGGRIVDDMDHPRRLTLDSLQAALGIGWRMRLIQLDKVMPSTADSQALSGGADGLFLTGKLAMYHSGLWKTPGFREIKDFDWDIAMFPKGPGGARGFFAGGSGYGMNRATKLPGEAWALLSFLVSAPTQRRLARTGLSQPSLRPVAESPDFLDGLRPRNKKMLLQAAQIGTPDPAWSAYQEFQTGIFMPATDMLWVNGFQGDVGQVLRELTKKANRQYFQVD